VDNANDEKEEVDDNSAVVFNVVVMTLMALKERNRKNKI
jgi:hypothetical protein